MNRESPFFKKVVMLSPEATALVWDGKDLWALLLPTFTL